MIIFTGIPLSIIKMPSKIIKIYPQALSSKIEFIISYMSLLAGDHKVTSKKRVKNTDT